MNNEELAELLKRPVWSVLIVWWTLIVTDFFYYARGIAPPSWRARPDYGRIKQLEIELGFREPDPLVPLMWSYVDLKKPSRPYKGFLPAQPAQKYTVPNNGQPPEGPYEAPWLRDISGE